MTHERNAQALLALVADDASRRIDAALAAAAADAHRLRQDAQAAARAAVRAAYTDERHRHRERVQAAEAALATRQRLALQRRNSALVAAGLDALPAALRERWRDGRSRAAWIDRALAQARASLPSAGWDVRHPPGLGGEEREALAATIRHATGHEPTLIAEAGLDAGLAIGCAGTLVDARLCSLVADRARLGARLLDRADAPLPEATQ